MKTKQTWKAPKALGEAIKRAKTKRELKPLLNAYDLIYGEIPDALCQLYLGLPK